MTAVSAIAKQHVAMACTIYCRHVGLSFKPTVHTGNAGCARVYVEVSGAAYVCSLLSTLLLHNQQDLQHRYACHYPFIQSAASAAMQCLHTTLTQSVSAAAAAVVQGSGCTHAGHAQVDGASVQLHPASSCLHSLVISLSLRPRRPQRQKPRYCSTAQ
jgi:hypothetical protein